MKTAAYSICKNEINKIDQWLKYTELFDYRVVLDTGSTDGTFELLKSIPDLIVDQFIPDKFRFDRVRNQCLKMIPKDVEWVACPDIDEYFSINVIDEFEKIVKQYPEATSISCARLDIRSKSVYKGPPKCPGINKLHKISCYQWKQPVFEHLDFIGPGSEVDIFCDSLFVIHDQEVEKPRSDFYFKILQDEYNINPSNSWNSWYLANEYFIKQDLENFVIVGMDFIKNADRDRKYQEMITILTQISNSYNVPTETRYKIKAELNQVR